MTAIKFGPISVRLFFILLFSGTICWGERDTPSQPVEPGGIGSVSEESDRGEEFKAAVESALATFFLRPIGLVPRILSTGETRLAVEWELAWGPHSAPPGGEVFDRPQTEDVPKTDQKDRKNGNDGENQKFAWRVLRVAVKNVSMTFLPQGGPLAFDTSSAEAIFFPDQNVTFAQGVLMLSPTLPKEIDFNAMGEGWLESVSGSGEVAVLLGMEPTDFIFPSILAPRLALSSENTDVSPPMAIRRCGETTVRILHVLRRRETVSMTVCVEFDHAFDFFDSFRDRLAESPLGLVRRDIRTQQGLVVPRSFRPIHIEERAATVELLFDLPAPQSGEGEWDFHLFLPTRLIETSFSVDFSQRENSSDSPSKPPTIRPTIRPGN